MVDAAQQVDFGSCFRRVQCFSLNDEKKEFMFMNLPPATSYRKSSAALHTCMILAELCASGPQIGEKDDASS
jgi:hypothetical protein